MIEIKKDDLTPFLTKLSKRLTKNSTKTLREAMRYGKKRIQQYARSDKSGKLAQGTHYRVNPMRGSASLWNIAINPLTGFNYSLFVNDNVSIRGKYPFFGKGQGKIFYGQPALSPSGKNIVWTVEPQFFDKGINDMFTKFDKLFNKILW